MIGEVSQDPRSGILLVGLQRPAGHRQTWRTEPYEGHHYAMLLGGIWHLHPACSSYGGVRHVSVAANLV